MLPLFYQFNFLNQLLARRKCKLCCVHCIQRPSNEQTCSIPSVIFNINTTTKHHNTNFNCFTDQNVIMRRHKSVAEDEDRPVRRVSYLRATANENALTIDSDLDNSPMSAPPGTPDDLQITQILRR